MKTFKQILAIIGIILYVNYIISSSVCVEEYTNRGTSICSEQHMHRQSTVKKCHETDAAYSYACILFCSKEE